MLYDRSNLIYNTDEAYFQKKYFNIINCERFDKKTTIISWSELSNGRYFLTRGGITERIVFIQISKNAIIEKY